MQSEKRSSRGGLALRGRKLKSALMARGAACSFCILHFALITFLFLAGCAAAPQGPAGFEVRFLPEDASAAAHEKDTFGIRPRDELLSNGDRALRMDFALNPAAAGNLSGLRVQIVCGGTLYSFAPKARRGTCVIPILPEGDIAVTAKLFSETGLVEEKHFLIPRVPNALEW
jgi:hypothetical protein